MKLFSIDLFTLDFAHIMLALVIAVGTYQIVRLRRSIRSLNSQMDKMDHTLDNILKIEEKGSDYNVRNNHY